MRRAAVIMDRMRRQDPAAWQGYLTELRTLELGAAGDGLTGVAADWPEYQDDALTALVASVHGRA